MAWRRKSITTGIAVALCGFAAWLVYIGYLGGPIYYEIAAEPGPSAVAPGAVALLLSGDMGFRVGMGPRIAARLAQDGIPVLGVSSLEYFRQRRSPADTRAFIADSARKALRFAHANHLILIGQSFGADALQYGAAGLSPELRAKIQLVALVVPGDTVNLRASPAELFDWAKPDASALSTARLLDWAPVVCIRGIEEENSLCPLLDLPNVRQVTLPGGHLLNRDADGLYAALRVVIASGGLTPNHITKTSESSHVPPI